MKLTTEQAKEYIKQGRGFSIITDFGCRKDCAYCVWKLHKLNDLKSKTDWNNLSDIIKEINPSKISISGGGDPLNGFETKNMQNWWDNLFEITNGIPLDIHTGNASIFDVTAFNFNKVVFHSNIHEYRLLDYDFFLENEIKFRIVFVLNYDWTINEIVRAISFLSRFNCEISFRELYGFEKTEDVIKCEKFLETYKKYDKLKFVKQLDYNIYYMPDNNLYDEYII